MKHKCFYEAISKWLNVVLPDVGADSSHISDMTAEKISILFTIHPKSQGT